MLFVVLKRELFSRIPVDFFVGRPHRFSGVPQKTNGRVAKILILASLLWFAMCSHANELPPVTGDILLTIEGNLSKSNSGSSLQIDLAMLESLPAVSFKTETPWTEGITEWEGVRLKDFMEFIGAGSERFLASALDEYEIVFENVNIDKYPVILAYKKDGEYMTVRSLGPLWIMFPYADFPELDVQFNRTLSVWQLVKMEIL